MSLRLTFTDVAEAELGSSYELMARFGFGVAEGWLSGIQSMLLKECETQAVLSVRHPRAVEIFPGRDIFVQTYTTLGGSSWRVLCEIVDLDRVRDTLRVVGIRHAARRGPLDMLGSEEEPESQ